MIAKLALLLCVLCATAVQAQSTESKVFSVLENPSGWKTPVLGSPIQKDVPYAIDLGQYGVSTPAFQLRQSFDLPYIYLTEDGTLNVHTMHAFAKSIFKLIAKEKLFGYCLIAFDKETAMAFKVWWIDEDGSGKFTRLVFSRNFPGEPAWVH